MEWLPGKPFSLDNYRSLTKDSVSDEDGLRRSASRRRLSKP